MRASQVNRTPIIKAVVYGSLVVTILLSVMLFISYSFFENHHVLSRLGCGLVTAAMLIVCVILLHSGRTNYAAIVTTLICYAVATIATITWSINTPFATLMFGYVILLAGIFFGSRAILPASLIVIITLLSIQTASSADIIQSYTLHFSSGSTYADILGYSVMLSIFGLIAWLSGRQIEITMSSLLIAKRKLEYHNKYIESELKREKEILRITQIEELGAIYRFAEIGRKTSILLHNLANQVTELTLEIPETTDDRLLKESRRTISSIGKLLNQAQVDIKETDQTDFTVIQLLKEVATKLSDRATSVRVELQVEEPSQADQAQIHGDRLLLTQAIEVIVSNSIDAYKENRYRRRRNVLLRTSQANGTVDIVIRDFGPGIPMALQSSLFKSPYTTKENGHGVGLYVSQQIIQHHFNGKISFISDGKRTIFHIKIPLANR